MLVEIKDNSGTLHVVNTDHVFRCYEATDGETSIDLVFHGASHTVRPAGKDWNALLAKLDVARIGLGT